MRKHLSRVKGGQLAAAAYPAKMLALMISDVPGDEACQVASGPTVPDAITLSEVRAMVAARNIADQMLVAFRNTFPEPPDQP